VFASSSLARPRPRAAVMAAAIVTLAGTAGPAHAAPVIGSSDTATADPPVARPSTTPCAVHLYANLAFADFSPKPFAYAPPAGCPGPWAKVVFTGDFAVTAGRQFDRTASVWIGGAAIYFGTTQEPSKTVAPTWHVERDLTDYAALFTTAQAGKAVLGNLVDGTYTGVISGSADLLFYPLERHQHAPATADLVLPLSDAADGGTVSLATPAATLTRTFTLPRNVARAYLDVYAQSQGGDEFWYTCVPDDLAGALQSCGGGAFREATVTIDGTPAGIAPVYPWIFTGGIDPYLWRPIPGVQTLAFAPYRVDLSPFAGVLSDGKPHAVAVAVAGAHDYFSVTASLLVHLDHGIKHVTGGLLIDTLAAAPTPTVTPQLTTGADGAVTGTIATASSRGGLISGWIHGSHGVEQLAVVQGVSFSNQQRFDLSASAYVQDIDQRTVVTTVSLALGARASSTSRVASWPLTLHYAYTTADDGSAAQTTTIRQGLDETEIATVAGIPTGFRTTSNVVAPTDTLSWSPTGAFLGPHGGSTQTYTAIDGAGACYQEALTAVDGVLTAIDDGGVCAP
jgi:Peptide N-acetyl-beta-D-glucosaminyl asparaginase amidase A